MSLKSRIFGIVKTSLSQKPVPGTETPISLDTQGRVVTYPYSIRESVSTASSVVTRNDRTEIMGAVTGAFTDIVMVGLSNTSTNAITIDLRSGYNSGITATLGAAAATTTTVKFDPPLPANESATPWVATASSVAADSGDSPVTVNIVAVQNL